MKKPESARMKFPIIYYEEPDSENDQASPIPYIEVEKDEPWYPVLFIQEYRHTGEEDIGPKGEPRPILDMVMHQYVDMLTLKEKLSPETYDVIRVALGMKPLQEAMAEGAKVLDKVENKLNAEKKKLH